MNAASRTTAPRWALPPLVGLAMTVVAAYSATTDALAQAPKTQDHSKHAQHADAKSAQADVPLADQIRQLRAKVATLEAALAQGHRGGGPAARGGPMPGMGMMGRMGGGAMSLPGGGAMPMMDDDSMEMGPMGGPPGGAGMGMMGMGSRGGGQPGAMAGGMGMMDDASEMSMMGMGAMGKAQGMAGMAVPSALPGFPGASHLYHVGATGFFLNHDAHVTLTPAQKAALNQIKQIAAHESPKTTRLYDRTCDQLSLDEIERIAI